MSREHVEEESDYDFFLDLPKSIAAETGTN